LTTTKVLAYFPYPKRTHYQAFVERKNHVIAPWRNANTEAKITSNGLKGLEGYRVQVEVQVVERMETIVIVGLPDASVKESKERVSAALYSMGHPLTDMKVVINLSSAEQKKNGPLFDLAIALGVLKSGDFLKENIPRDAGFLGTLSLDGMIAAILAAKKLKLKKYSFPMTKRYLTWRYQTLS